MGEKTPWIRENDLTENEGHKEKGKEKMK